MVARGITRLLHQQHVGRALLCAASYFLCSIPGTFYQIYTQHLSQLRASLACDLTMHLSRSTPHPPPAKQVRGLLKSAVTEFDVYRKTHIFPTEAYRLLLLSTRAYLSTLLMLAYPLQARCACCACCPQCGCCAQAAAGRPAAGMLRMLPVLGWGGARHGAAAVTCLDPQYCSREFKQSTTPPTPKNQARPARRNLLAYCASHPPIRPPCTLQSGQLSLRAVRAQAAEVRVAGACLEQALGQLAASIDGSVMYTE